MNGLSYGQPLTPLSGFGATSGYDYSTSAAPAGTLSPLPPPVFAAPATTSTPTTTPNTAAATDADGSPSWFTNNRIEGIGAIADVLGSFGQIYSAIQATKLAREQLKFTKEAYNTNLVNQTKSYNTSLEDRIRSRYTQENRTTSDADAYLARHAL